MFANESGQWTDEVCPDKGWGDPTETEDHRTHDVVTWDDSPREPRMSPTDDDDDEYYDDDDDDDDDDDVDDSDADFDDDDDDDDDSSSDEDDDGGELEKEDK